MQARDNGNARERGVNPTASASSYTSTASEHSLGSAVDLSSNLGSVSNPASNLPALAALSASFLYQRFMFSRSTGYGHNTQFQGKRDLNLILGYDDAIEISQYRYQYDRGGIAKRIVEIFPKATWGNGFDIKDDPNLKRKTPFEKSLKALYDKLGVHQRLLRASILAYLGHYSIILIGAPGDPESELPRSNPLSGIDEISYLMPLGEDKVKIAELVGQGPGDLNNNLIHFDPRFGLPRYYEINLSGSLARNQISNPSINHSPSFSKKVHWTRVIHLVRSPLDNDIIGEPILRAVWDLLYDLKKVIGGGAEASLRRGWPTLHANFDKDAKASEAERNSVKDQLDELAVGLQNSIRSRALSLTPLSSDGQILLKPNAEAIISQIAGTIGAPMRLILGSERGDLASSQDRSNFSDRIMELRAFENEPAIRQLNGRLIEYGYLPPPRNSEYEIIWPEEEELDEEGKARVAKLLAESKTLTTDEIRDRIFGLEAMEIEDKEQTEREKEIEEEDEEETDKEEEEKEDDKDSTDTPPGEDSFS